MEEKKNCTEAKSTVIVQILMFLSGRKSNCCRTQCQTSQNPKQLISVLLGDQKPHVHNYKFDPSNTCREPVTFIIFLLVPFCFDQILTPICLTYIYLKGYCFFLFYSELYYSLSLHIFQNSQGYMCLALIYCEMSK